MTESSFIDLYLDAIGINEVPTVYHEWGAISLLAACLNDRVWFEKFPGKKLYPNLYVTLVGASGSGKDSAIDHASSFVEKVKVVHEFYGKVSGAGLADVLAQPSARRASIAERPTVWLVFPELANSIGKGSLADEFVKRLTALSEGKDKKYQEVTRTLLAEGNELSYDSPLINCLFGSTQKWLIECVTADAIASGFFARMFVIDGSYNPNVRITNPTRPSNYKLLMDALGARVRAVTQLTGCFTMTKQAAAIRDRWYQTRPLPDDERLYPSWKRQDDQVLKVAMVLSPAVQWAHTSYESTHLVITGDAMAEAQRVVQSAHKDLPNLLRWANRSGPANSFETVVDAIQSANRIPHSTLLKRVTSRGIHAKELRDYVNTLVEREDINIERNKNGGKLYVWLGKKQ